MASQNFQLHLAFFPFLSHSHMIATLDVAKLFASRGHKVSLITTPANAIFFTKSIQKCRDKGFDITLHFIKFPFAEVGLPEGCETMNYVSRPELRENFLKVIPLLRKPLEQFLQEHRPHVLVADTYFSWATDSAAKYNIPRLIFHGTCNFAICTSLCLIAHQPFKKVSSDSELFTVPNLPGEIKFTRNQLPEFLKIEGETEVSKAFRASAESDSKCYGVLVNSFYEVEGAYSDYYRNVIGRKCWNIGPVSLCNEDFEETGNRGNPALTCDHECLKWLDSKEPNSVVYISFGTTTKFNNAQLIEVALGLESSGQQFIWVVKKDKEDDGDGEWLPRGFEKRMKEQGLILRGWAPQLLVLRHKAMGGFVTHCGWNSVMEAVSAGVPMVTWPVGAEQFFNEKLVSQVMRIGVEVGVQKWVRWEGDFVKQDAIERALIQIMRGEEAEERRKRAGMLAEKARKAVAEGGSSYNDLDSLVQDLKSLSL